MRRDRKDIWHTYVICENTHLHQVRRTRGGKWQKRILENNGTGSMSGPIETINEIEGEANYLTAQERDKLDRLILNDGKADGGRERHRPIANPKPTLVNNKQEDGSSATVKVPHSYTSPPSS
jgi:hypothetical protein